MNNPLSPTSHNASSQFLPLSEFPHLNACANLNDFFQKVSVKDFEAGFNPFEPEVLKLNGYSYKPTLNLLQDYYAYTYSYGFTQKHTAKEITQIQTSILDLALKYAKNKMFTVEQLQPFFTTGHLLAQKITADFVLKAIEAKIIPVSFTVSVKGHRFGAYQDIKVPLIFALRSLYVRPFFEKLGAEVIKGLSFQTGSGVYYNSLRSYDYLAYATTLKDKKALALCAEYFETETLAQEQSAIEKLLNEKTGPRERFNLLILEIKKHNSLLPSALSSDNLLPVLKNKKAGKNAVFFAIENKNISVLEALIALPYFQNNKKATNSLGHCALGYAAHKGQVSVEKFLLEKDYFDIESLGTPPKRAHNYVLSASEKAYKENATKLSDESCLKLKSLGVEFRLDDMIVERNIKTFTALIEENPALVASSEVQKEMEYIVENWLEKTYHKNPTTGRTATHNQNSLPLVLQSIKSLQNLPPNIANHTYTEYANILEKKYLEALAKIEAPTTAGFVMNQYLKYFPENKSKLTRAVSGLTNTWAIKFDKRNLEAELQQFLVSFEKPVKEETAPKKKHKI